MFVVNCTDYNLHGRRASKFGVLGEGLEACGDSCNWNILKAIERRRGFYNEFFFLRSFLRKLSWVLIQDKWNYDSEIS